MLHPRSTQVTGEAGFTSGDVRLVFEGDSLTQGYGIATGQDYPSQCVRMLGRGPLTSYGYNLAVGGSVIATMAARAAACDALLGVKGTNWLVAWCGSNDIGAGATGLDTLGAYVGYLIARRSAGWKVAAVTIIPRYSDPFMAQLPDFNANLLAGWSGVSDLLIDLAANTAFDEKADTVNYTNYQNDSVHLTSTGAAIVAGIVKTRLLTTGNF